MMEEFGRSFVPHPDLDQRFSQMNIHQRVQRLGTLALGLMAVAIAGGAEIRHPAIDWAEKQARLVARKAEDWYRTTPPVERVTWSGLAICACGASLVSIERCSRLRQGKIVPRAYLQKFHSRLIAGRIDRAKSADYCELNPSPAARVVLGAIKRWGQSIAEMERGVSLAKQVEIVGLRRHIGTLWRIAALSPLIGLLGSLQLASRALATTGLAGSPALGASLAPLTAGVALAILCLVAYDGLSTRIEGLIAGLDRLGAEAVDAISAAVVTPAANPRKIRLGTANSLRAAHSTRADIPLDSA